MMLPKQNHWHWDFWLSQKHCHPRQLCKFRVIHIAWAGKVKWKLTRLNHAHNSDTQWELCSTTDHVQIWLYSKNAVFSPTGFCGVLTESPWSLQRLHKDSMDFVRNPQKPVGHCKIQLIPCVQILYLLTQITQNVQGISSLAYPTLLDL